MDMMIPGDCWLNDLWKYDIETKHWTCIQESSGPSAVRSGDTSTTNIEMAARNENNEPRPQLNAMILRNAGSGGIPPVQGKVPTRRFGYVSVVHNGKFVLFGGFDVSFVHAVVVAVVALTWILLLVSIHVHSRPQLSFPLTHRVRGG
jgi:Galactose oxidase, central domain